MLNTRFPILLSIAMTAAQPSFAGDLFGLNSGAGGVLLIEVDQVTAASTVVGPTGLGTGGGAIGPDGAYWSVNNGSGDLVRIDLATGATLSTIGNTGLLFTGFSFHPITGELWAITIAPELVTIDTTTAAVTTITTSLTGLFGGIEWSLDGNTLYGAEAISSTLYSIDPVAGTQTPIGVGSNGLFSLAIDPCSGQLYGTIFQGGGGCSDAPCRGLVRGRVANDSRADFYLSADDGPELHSNLRQLDRHLVLRSSQPELDRTLSRSHSQWIRSRCRQRRHPDRERPARPTSSASLSIRWIRVSSPCLVAVKGPYA